MSPPDPFVSVIIPVYNEAETIGECLDAVTSQTYPRSNYEVLVVDNGSTDATPRHLRDAAATHENVSFLREDSVSGSYAARNNGIESARGDILAFLDGDCVPVPEWLEAGVSTFAETDADLVGGNVEFTYPAGRTAAEIFDSFTNMQMEENIASRNVAKTANLFVREEVVTDIGPFPNHLLSGGDVYWTEKATDAGYTLVFAPGAVCHHAARPFGALLKKQYRVGRGQIQTWRMEEATLRRRLSLFAWILSGFLPKPPHYLSRDLRRTDQSVSREMFVRVLAVAWCCRLAENAGRLSYLLRGDDR